MPLATGKFMLTQPDRQRLGLYSPVAFLRAHADALAALECESLQRCVSEGEVQVTDDGAAVFYRHLDWDSQHFGVPVYRLEFARCDPGFEASATEGMARAYTKLASSLAHKHGCFYVFAEVPSEDIEVLQALGLAGFRLIESRLTYYRDDVQSYEAAQRHATRLAEEADVPNLQDVARRSRNAFDRYHADPFFSTAEADDYVATYVANSVRGFSDMVIVPAPDADPPGAFLTGSFDRRHGDVCGLNLARIPLTAVAPERRGWNRRLNSELMHWFKAHGTQAIYTTTQPTNRAAIRVLETLRYAYGRSTHVFALGVAGPRKGARDDR